jgi:hypothetical protein
MKNHIIEFVSITILFLIALVTIKNRKPKTKTRGKFIISLIMKGNMTPAKINTVEGINLIAKFKDADGNEMKVEDLASAPVWASSDNAIATVVPAPDGSNANVVPATPVNPGTVQVTCTAEGDPTPGKDTIVIEQDIIIVSDEATQGTIVVGTPTPLGQLPAPVNS